MAKFSFQDYFFLSNNILAHFALFFPLFGFFNWGQRGIQNCNCKCQYGLTLTKWTLQNGCLLHIWEGTQQHSKFVIRKLSPLFLCSWSHSVDINFLPLSVFSTVPSHTLVTFEQVKYGHFMLKYRQLEGHVKGWHSQQPEYLRKLMNGL